MITILLHLLRLLPFFVGGHRHLAFENLALRHQLAVYRRTVRRLKLRTSDRLLWVWRARMWTDSEARTRDGQVPDTVVRWQRRRFQDYSATRSA